jgi:hypothetical protein
LTLTTDYVAASAIKPATIMGKSNIKFWGRKEVEGRNRPLGYSISGAHEKGRAYWFMNVPQPKFDGSIGPWAIPHERIIVGLTPATGTEVNHDFTYYGNLNNGSFGFYREAGFATSVGFIVERDMRYPIASAATGAAIAQYYGGTLSGDEWQEAFGFGITRPVRLLTLERPFVVGPFSFTKIAVRIRNKLDSASTGAAIAEQTDDSDVDPQEIVVTGTSKKGKPPAYSFVIGRAVLNQCATITFDKAARIIRASCRPA